MHRQASARHITRIRDEAAAEALRRHPLLPGPALALAVLLQTVAVTWRRLTR